MVTVNSSIVLPNSVLSAGIRGRVIRMNARTQTQGGYVFANAIWQNSLREYEVGLVPLSVGIGEVDWITDLLAVFEATDGGVYGFLMEDPVDNTAVDEIVQQDDDGNWRLYRRYSKGGQDRDRKITRPRAPVVYIEGVAADATVDAETGIVTWGEDEPGEGDTVTWNGRFYVPVHFVNDAFEWELVRGGAPAGRLVLGQNVLLREVRE